ncbi:MAG: sugar phosphate nucleotidyltransferase [Acidobacteriota bacterium]
MSGSGFRVAMVLAAGRGERMRPLSDVVPKPALPMPDGPVIGSALRLAVASGVERVVVNTWHLGRRMAAAIDEIELPRVELVLSPESQLMGTAGGLALARDRGLLGDDGPILVLNGDGLLGLSVEFLKLRHGSADDLVTLALLPHLDPNRWSRVLLDANGLVTHIQSPGPPAQEEAPFLYPGVMAVSRTALDALPSNPGEIPDLLWRPAHESGRLGGVVMAGHWREVGTPSDYREVIAQRLGETSTIRASSMVAAEARISASFIGDSVVVQEGAVVENSVVAEGVVIRCGARVQDSLVFGAIEVESGQTIVDEVLARAP